MAWYLLAKWFHIFGVCGMVGTTLCNGLLHRMALQAPNAAARQTTLSQILLLNRWVMAPSFVALIGGGLAMVSALSLPALPGWLSTSMVLTAVLVLAFIVGYGLEHRLWRLAGQPDTEHRYRRVFLLAVPVGLLATLLSGVVIYLMIRKAG
ncbi:DUF2269 family protein [Reinekea sp. G2M2-21]|uniref:DUF2269 family protein n=1 Tax=Reinekea sp. G2M2-21 TaxID=2788942 RepID=UPI0018AC69CE|nr:DUF2269 family protein [Reinekea sp. G2M2-21]